MLRCPDVADLHPYAKALERMEKQVNPKTITVALDDESLSFFGFDYNNG